MKKKIIIFGTGNGAKKALLTMEKEKYEITAFVDNNAEKQGTYFEGIRVISPEEINGNPYERIVICSTAFCEIKKQLITIGIESDKLADRNYFHEQRFLDYYSQKCFEKEEEIQEILRYVKKHGLGVFNYPFTEQYMSMEINPVYDHEKSMFYVIYKDKRMYLKKEFDTTQKVIDYCRWLNLEQDEDSPHKYFDDDFQLEMNAVVLDAGVAEGNFALDVIDRVEKIYLVETDASWIEALRVTFEPYKDKVVFVNKFLTDFSDSTHITIDDILNQSPVSFIKMDIEGAEEMALKGAQKTLLSNKKMMLDICTYHREDAGENISAILEKEGFGVSYSKGYMVFDLPEYYTENYTRKLVRGLIKGKRG